MCPFRSAISSLYTSFDVVCMKMISFVWLLSISFLLHSKSASLHMAYQFDTDLYRITFKYMTIAVFIEKDVSQPSAWVRFLMSRTRQRPMKITLNCIKFQ